MNKARRPNMIVHRSRDIGALTGRHAGKRLSYISMDDEQACRQAYIDFINRLMQRMKMDGIDQMLDKAIDIVK